MKARGPQIVDVVGTLSDDHLCAAIDGQLERLFVAMSGRWTRDSIEQIKASLTLMSAEAERRRQERTR